MITIVTPNGTASGDIADVLAAVDNHRLCDLPAMAPEWRPGVVTSLAIVRCVLRLFTHAARDWDANAYRAAWDRQLGAGTRRLLAPLDEPGLFQPPMSRPDKAHPLPIQHLTGFAALQHVQKLSYAAEAETVLLGILGGTWRPHANYNPATARSGTLVLLPGDGTLGSEILTLSDALQAGAKPGRSPRDHFPWLEPRSSKPYPLAALPSPWLDIERAIRITDNGALIEPSNGRWVVRDSVVDPSMAINLSGSSAGAPWRPKAETNAAVILHKAIAGNEDLARPALMQVVDQQPQVRICVLHGVHGTTEGYREWELAIPRKHASLFARSPDVVAEISQRLLEAVTAMTRGLRSALSAAQLSPEVRDRYLTQASDAAWHESVELLLGLAPQQTIHRTMRRAAWRGFESATLTSNAMNRARGEDRLRAVLYKTFPLPDQEMRMTIESPMTVRQAHAAVKAMDAQLSPHDRAKLRTAVPGRFSIAVTAIVLSGAGRSEALDGAEGEAWETVALALGSMRATGPAVGRLLAASGYPEMRMQQLLSSRGSALRAQVRSAVRWLLAKGTAAARLGDLMALMLADARADADALRHARRELAVGYVHGAQKEVVETDSQPA